MAIEGRASRPGDAESGEADVIDHTTREALQMKVVSGATEDAVLRNVNSAVDQLGGAGGEHPPAGYTRIADIRIVNPDNPLAFATREQVLAALRGGVTRPGNLEPGGVLRVTNLRGTYEITPGELR